MFASIPYFYLPVWNIPVPGLGNLPIDPWFTLVCIGFVVGLEIARARAIKLGLEVRHLVDGAIFIVISGFLIGHVFTVIAYKNERLSADEPVESLLAFLRFWEGFSSMGGFIGAVLAAVVYYRLLRSYEGWLSVLTYVMLALAGILVAVFAPAQRSMAYTGLLALAAYIGWLAYKKELPRVTRREVPLRGMRYADAITFGFPFGWFFGRVGCGVVHDHIGAPTSFPLAMEFPGLGVRHELGLYEAAYSLLIALAFWQLGQKDRPPGFFLAAFGLFYAPVRFGLDFLRNTDLSGADSRYLGLTPGHYGSIAMFVASAILMAWVLRRPHTPLKLDGSGEPVAPAEPAGVGA